MKKLGVVVFAFALLGASSPPVEPDADVEALATARRVHGVVTAVEPATITIASIQHTVTGRVDPERTKVTVRGKPGRLADVRLTAHAKGELCLDDVWLAIDVH
jgi:hypothetical protein